MMIRPKRDTFTRRHDLVGVIFKLNVDVDNLRLITVGNTEDMPVLTLPGSRRSTCDYLDRSMVSVSPEGPRYHVQDSAGIIEPEQRLGTQRVDNPALQRM